MIISMKPAIAGLLLVALACLCITSAHSRSVTDEETKAIKQHVEHGDDKFLTKREAGDEEEGHKTKKHPAAKRTKKGAADADATTTTTAKPAGHKKHDKSGASTTGKPASKKNKSAKKTQKDGPKTTSTTAAPDKSKTTTPPPDKSKTTTPPPDDNKTTTPTPDDSKTTTPAADTNGSTKKPDDTKPRSHGAKSKGVRHRAGGNSAAKLKIANERWLQNQEVVAIEHMLAGAYDWIKVLKQTKGRTYSEKVAGELFDKINNELLVRLREKPSKLIAHYRAFKAEGGQY